MYMYIDWRGKNLQQGIIYHNTPHFANNLGLSWIHFAVDHGKTLWDTVTETWKFWFVAILIPLLCCCCGVYKYKRRKGRGREHGAGTHNFVLICTCTSSLYHRCHQKSPAKGSTAEHYLCFCFLKKKIICQLFCRVDFTLSRPICISTISLHTIQTVHSWATNDNCQCFISVYFLFQWNVFQFLHATV